jgi:hypothetical protein
LPIQEWALLESYMEHEKIDLSTALARCIRHGVIRLAELEAKGEI